MSDDPTTYDNGALGTATVVYDRTTGHLRGSHPPADASTERLSGLGPTAGCDSGPWRPNDRRGKGFTPASDLLARGANQTASESATAVGRADSHHHHSASQAPLSSAAYHRVFTVLEYCDGVDSVIDVAQRLVSVLPQVYQCQIATFFSGHTLSSAIEDPMPVIEAPPDTDALWNEYCRTWRSSDVYASSVAQSELTRNGVAVLRYLDEIPAASVSYVNEFLGAGGIPGSAAIRVALAGGDIGLVGMFDPDPDCFTREDARGLALLAGRLSALTRLMPYRPADDILDGVAGSCREVALLIGQGMSNAAVASQLCLAEDTVKKYVSRVLASTGCRSRTELAVRVQQHVGKKSTFVDYRKRSSGA